jgi:ferritin-like protein
MAASSAGLHESAESMSPQLIDRHRAIVSIQEELEAVDWYDQRAAATDDPSLAAILVHNRDEEKEHASMMLEWLRRHDAALDKHLRTYLFTDAPVTEIEVEVEHDEGAGTASAAQPRPADGSLGIGGLRGRP